ncbi:MAG: CTP synthase [Rickettsiales bacterium]
MKTKFVFITGGVVSSLGKGLASASLGALLQARGYKVCLRKLDPYLNIDPGTMSPTQHGEVFVTDDGAETDLDLGHYERFVGITSTKYDNVTSGKIYSTLLQRERRGEYLGGTVQVIPHVTNLIKEFIFTKSDNYDFVLCEIGGTVGDIEALPYFEAIRQIRNELQPDDAKFVHLTLLPYVAAAKELKTKPTQHSVKELRAIGIQPDILLCRSSKDIPESELKKIALFCNVHIDRVIPALDVKIIYEAPLSYHEAGFDRALLDSFGLNNNKPDLSKWEQINHKIKNAKNEITLGIVGKYNLHDAYLSLVEAIKHAAIDKEVTVNIKWINARRLKEDNVDERMNALDAVVVPGGFGNEGIEGKILAIKYSRENNVPILGICLGMQLTVVEYARNVIGIPDACSSEFGKCNDPVIGLMTEWSKGSTKELRSKDDDLGGTMRLGAYPCVVEKGTTAYEIYKKGQISERHRHRYEFNINYKDKLSAKDLVFSGMSPDGKLAEIVENKSHPWMIAVQFHPEFLSKPFAPHPLFSSLIGAAIKRDQNGKK